ncbi:hypothetical protein VTN96DRAFT_5754 [Rasamsonia emersonii]
MRPLSDRLRHGQFVAMMDGPHSDVTDRPIPNTAQSRPTCKQTNRNCVNFCGAQCWRWHCVLSVRDALLSGTEASGPRWSIGFGNPREGKLGYLPAIRARAHGAAA